MKRNLFVLFFAILALAIMLKDASAFTATGTLNITATVPSGCAVTTTPVNFGAYLSGQPSDVFANGNVSVNCPAPTPYNIDLSPGIYYDGFVRQMNNGGSFVPNDFLQYNLYWDNSYTTKAGAFAGGTTAGGIGNLYWQNYTIYGRILGFQTVNPGNFSDSVSVTVTW